MATPTQTTTTTPDVNTWTPEQVSAWVTEQGYKPIAGHFTEQNINGTALLALVDADMKGAPFNLKIGDTKNFLIKVDTLRQSYTKSSSPKHKRAKLVIDNDPLFQKYCEDTRRHWKQLPVNTYSSYKDIRSQMCFFKDTTGIIEFLQDKSGSAFSYLRPPRFGKSLLLSVLEHFYGVQYCEDFDFYFRGTIAQNLKLGANHDLIFRINMSNITLTMVPFNAILAQAIRSFTGDYGHLITFPPAPSEVGADQVIPYFKDILKCIEKSDYSVKILIDEYDHPVNEWMLLPDREASKGILKVMTTFYSVIKENLNEDCVSLCFLTGVFRMALAEISAGFNCCTDLSFNDNLITLLGLLDEDVDCLLGRQPNVDQRFKAQMKRECNGYKFASEATTVFCTNFVFAKLMNQWNKDGTSQILPHASAVLDYISATAKGIEILEALLNDQNIEYDLSSDTNFKFNQLGAQMPGNLLTSILLHLGVATWQRYNNKFVHVTNPSMKTLIAQHLNAKTFSINVSDALHSLLVKHNIDPMLEYVRNNGVFTSLKAESFDHNEIVPHNMFAVVANLRHNDLVKYEHHVVSSDNGGSWIDVFISYADVGHVIEWKNIHLDYIVIDVPGIDNGANLVRARKKEAVEKVKHLRAMTNKNVEQLHISSFDRFNPNKTVQQLISDTFIQTSKYVKGLQSGEHAAAKYYMHVCVAVGSSKILYETREYVNK